MPLQEGVILQRTKVRVPSAFALFLSHSFAGIVGAVGVAAAAEALRRNTRLSPLALASITSGVGVLGGALVGKESPRLGTGILLGAVAAAVPSVLESVETSLSLRNSPAESPTIPTEASSAASSPAPMPPSGAVMMFAPDPLMQGGEPSFLLAANGSVIRSG